MNKVVIENLIPISNLIGVSASWVKFFTHFLTEKSIQLRFAELTGIHALATLVRIRAKFRY